MIFLNMGYMYNHKEYMVGQQTHVIVIAALLRNTHIPPPYTPSPVIHSWLICHLKLLNGGTLLKDEVHHWPHGFPLTVAILRPGDTAQQAEGVCEICT